MTIILKPFYFVRHGETDWNRQKIVMGLTDIPLNELGRAQATDIAQRLAKEPIEHIATSPLLRAHKTAEIIAHTINKPITVIDNLKEYHWGIAEGKPEQDHEILWERWLSGEPYEGGEGKYDFLDRITQGVTEAQALSDNTLIVSHGGVYVGLMEVLGLPVLELRNCEAIFHKPPTNPEDLWTSQGINATIVF